MSPWSQDETLQFLKLYQGAPVLWDPKHEHRKDKKKLYDAWLRIHRALQIPVEELKKKKESLLATFRGYYRKKQTSIKSGAALDEVYQPIWFAYDMMEKFLKPADVCNPTIKIENTVSMADSNKQENEEESLEENQEYYQEFSPTNRSVNVEEGRTCSPNTNIRQTVRCRSNPPELLNATIPMSDVFNTLNNANNRQNVEEDECDLFGKLISKKLKKLPEHEKEELMYEIQGLFLRRSRHPYCPPSTSTAYISRRRMSSATPPLRINGPSSSHGLHSEPSPSPALVHIPTYLPNLYSTSSPPLMHISYRNGPPLSMSNCDPPQPSNHPSSSYGSKVNIFSDKVIAAESSETILGQN